MTSCVYVSGYKAGTTIEDLIIYFQSKESGGGDIEEESCKFEGEEAVIMFDEEQDKRRVLAKGHSLNGCKLTVLPTSSKTKIRQSKVTSSKKHDVLLERDKKANKKPKVGEIRTVIVSGICPQTTNNTLELFFENQRRSGGGDIERLERFEPDVAHITFCSAQVAPRVLKKERLEVDGYLLELKAKKPEIPLERDKKANKKPKVGEIRTVIVSGIRPQTTNNTLELFFENQRRSGGGDIERLERFEPEVAHITFCSAQVASRVLKKERLEVDGYLLELKAKKPETPLEHDIKADKKPKVGEIRTVIVSGICPQTTNNTLELFFENQRRSGGGDIERLERFEPEIAHITFCSAQVASRVLKKEHLEVDGYFLELKAKKPETPLEHDIKADKKPKVGEIRTVIVSGICPQTTNNTLELFFENQRRSGGGDIERLERFEPEVAHITFCSAQVASRVLKAERLEVDGCLLELKAKKPDVIFPPDKKKLLVENLDPKTSEDSLLNYVEVVTGLNVAALEFGKKKNAIVTLDKEPDLDKVNKKAKNKRLEGAVLKIAHPPVCNSILVTGLSENTTKDAIELKFENPRYGGGEILDVVYHENEGKAVVSFLDPNVIDSVTAKEHCLNSSTLVVRPYYPLLEDDADMMERNKVKIIPVTQDVMHHISNRCDEEFSRLFGFSISDAKYDEEKEELVFTVTRKLAEKIDDIQRYFNQFTVTEMAVSKKLQTDSKQEVEEILTKVEDKNIAHATLDEEKQCIVVTGKKKKAEELVKNLQHELEELEKKKEVVTVQISIDPYKSMLIYSLGFEEHFDLEPDIDVKIDCEKGILTAKGSQSQVNSARLQALEELSKIKEDYIELNERQEQYFQSRGLTKVNQDLKEKKVNALICLDKSKPGKARVELFHSEKYDKVKQLVMKEVPEESYTLEEESVQLLNNEKWRSSSCLKHGNGASPPQAKMFRGRGSNESGLAMRQPSYVSSKYQGKVHGSESFMSMPTVHSVGNKQHGPDFYSRNDSQLIRRYQHNPNIKTGQKKDYVGRSSSMQMGGRNISSTEISKYHEKFEENQKISSVYLPQLRNSFVEDMSVQDKFDTEGLSGHQYVSNDTLLAEKKRAEEILSRRLEGSKGSIYQKSSMQTESSNDIVADNVSGKNKLQCYICGEVPVVICEKCQEVVCKDCLKIMTNSPCIINQEHEYKVIEEVAWSNKVSSSLFPQVNNPEKWQCEHCTLINSADRTVCVTCNRTKDVKVQQPEPGGWICDICTLVNPKDTSQCIACEERRGKNPYTFIG